MNKKNKIGIIIIIILIIIMGGFIITSVNSEIVINDVVGVNNVKLDSDNFTFSNLDIQTEGDNYHVLNGDVIIEYTNTSNTIRFDNVTNDYNSSSFYKDWLQNDSYSTTEPLIIGNIKGYIYKDESMGDESFFFVINNKIYMISVDDGSVESNKEGINLLLTAWLEASGLKQTWEYPNTTSTTVNSETKTTTNNDNVNQGNDNTKVINGVIYTQEDDGLIYELHPGDPGYEKEIKKYS